MPVYGQSTEFIDRLSSLMSAIVCNTNDLYDGLDRPVSKLSTITPPRLKNTRPLFTEAILRKASQLEELVRASGTMLAPTQNSTLLEVVLVAEPDDWAGSHELAKYVSALFGMPQDHTHNCFLEVTTVRSHAIREDLAVARSSRSPPGGSPQRWRVFVALGSALQGFCLYLLREEVLRRRDGPSREEPLPQSPSSSPSAPQILGVVCVDPPPHLWKACGRSVLEQTSREEIPSLWVGYTDGDNEKSTEESMSPGLGALLGDCRHYPRALALVARDSAKVLRPPRGRSTIPDREHHATVWLARLVAKYAESLQRIRVPPRGPDARTGTGRSRL